MNKLWVEIVFVIAIASAIVLSVLATLLWFLSE
jgi:hypothetical protein